MEVVDIVFVFWARLTTVDLFEMSNDVGSLGILFEVQWKKKPGGNSREDVASIGIWDTPDASLDWLTFKSYVVSD